MTKKTKNLYSITIRNGTIVWPLMITAKSKKAAKRKAISTWGMGTFVIKCKKL